MTGLVDSVLTRLGLRKDAQSRRSPADLQNSPFEQVTMLLEELAFAFNRQNQDPSLAIVVQKFDESASSSHLPVQMALLGSYQRMFIFNSMWTLSLRFLPGQSLEVFLCQSAKLVEIEGMELLSNCKLKLERDKESGEWKSNTFSVSRDEIDLIVKSIFRDLIRRSVQDAQSVPEYLRLPLSDTGLSLNSAVQELIRDKQELSQRIVDEHEQIYGSVARDLHDAVINNVLAIKRLLGSDPDSLDRVSALLDDVYSQLRDICNDMAPRDLQACGLQLIIDDLVERFAETASLDAVTDWCCAVPDLPLEVQMHIYRIVQECLNNVAKHSTAKHVWVRFTQEENRFTVVIEDDGKRSAKPEQSQQGRSSSGRGRGIMAERAQLMNRLCPTRLRINTDRPQGFKVELSIEVKNDKSSIAGPR